MSNRCLFIAFGLLVAACSPGEPEEPVPLESAAPLSATESARLFQRRCASCHGAQGRGDGPSAPIVSPADLTDAALQARITDADIALLLARGRGAMPPFSSLSDIEVNGLIRHVRTLGIEPTDEGSR